VLDCGRESGERYPCDPVPLLSLDLQVSVRLAWSALPLLTAASAPRSSPTDLQRHSKTRGVCIQYKPVYATWLETAIYSSRAADRPTPSVVRRPSRIQTRCLTIRVAHSSGEPIIGTPYIQPCKVYYWAQNAVVCSVVVKSV